MREKLLLAAAATFALNLLIGISTQSAGTVSGAGPVPTAMAQFTNLKPLRPFF